MRGAREHNLKNITVELPRDRLVVITGLSGSGKSSLAFDTIYAEGQRRYVEIPERLRAPVPGPDGEAGRRPDRRPVAGHQHRPEGRVAQPALDRRHGHGDLRPPAPAVRARRSPALPQRPRDRAPERAPDRGQDPGPARWRAHPRPWPAHPRPQDGGRPRLRGGTQAGLRPRPGGRRRCSTWTRCKTLDKYKRHTIEVVVDRLVVHHADDDGKPLARSHPNPERGRFCRLGRDGAAPGRGHHRRRTGGCGRVRGAALQREVFSCPFDGYTIDELEPRSFSFNSPHGACPACTGLGRAHGVRHGARGQPQPVHLGGRAAAVVTHDHDRLVVRQGRRGASPSAAASRSTCRSRKLKPETSTSCSTRRVARRCASAIATRATPTTTTRRSRDCCPIFERRYRETESEWVKTGAREVHGRPAVSHLWRHAAQARSRSASPSTA